MSQTFNFGTLEKYILPIAIKSRNLLKFSFNDLFEHWNKRPWVNHWFDLNIVKWKMKNVTMLQSHYWRLFINKEKEKKSCDVASWAHFAWHFQFHDQNISTEKLLSSPTPCMCVPILSMGILYSTTMPIISWTRLNLSNIKPVL